jgi:glycosyltransferase involved in cell wall biosynthesis
VQNAMLNDSRIRISEPGPRLGYSKSVLNAIRNSRGSILIFLDGDGQSSPFDVIKLVEHLKKKNQIIIGVRQQRKDSFSRKIYSRLFKLFYEILGFPKLEDPSSGSIIAFREFVFPIIEHDLFLNLGFWWEFQAYMQKYLPSRLEVEIPHYSRQFGLTKVYKRSSVLLIGIKHVIGLWRLRIYINSHPNNF